MMLPEFFAILKKSPRRWIINTIGDIEFVPQRNVSTGCNYCPLTYVYVKVKKHAVNQSKFLMAGKALGFDAAQTSDIVAAADNRAGMSATQKTIRLLLINATQPKGLTSANIGGELNDNREVS